MNPILVNIMVGLSGYVMTRLDRNIDEPEERKALALKIRNEIEDKLGRDIPFLDDKREIEVIIESLVMVHKGLSSISQLLDTK